MVKRDRRQTLHGALTRDVIASKTLREAAELIESRQAPPGSFNERHWVAEDQLGAL